MAARAALAAAAAGALALAAGCVVVQNPGQPMKAEWAGTYARQQAAENDRERAIALAVRQRFDQDPVLKGLRIAIFVTGSEVTLCGKFPSDQDKARAYGLAEGVDGVAGVDSDCGD